MLVELVARPIARCNDAKNMFILYLAALEKGAIRHAHPH